MFNLLLLSSKVDPYTVYSAGLYITFGPLRSAKYFEKLGTIIGLDSYHGVLRRMISVDNFFVFLRLLFLAVLLLYVT